uniref:Prolyl 4-hydroxylase alpha subunit domain-containing protein n=1 Tax=Arcella intermedia TaxID=1963864 RepID=A0A6B2L3W4_9EUKA
MDALRELKSEKWFKKRNDLYTFKQTDDFKNTTKPTLRDFRSSLISDEFLSFLTSITNIEFNGNIDLAGQHYQRGGNLLCHDDELDGRRIAFIWYLVDPSWSEKDGGEFCLYGNDGGQPEVDYCNKVVPEWNMVVFFETTPTTWHQVAEVLSNQDRYTISGWFHGSVIPRPPFLAEPPVPELLLDQLPSGFQIADYIDPQYLVEETQNLLKKRFGKDSSIGLCDFLKQEKYDLIFNELRSSQWKVIGPPTRRYYGSLGRPKGERETGEVLQLKNFLKSKEMILFLQKITGLKIIASEEGEVRCFSAQNYTLVHDNEHQHKTFGLDLSLGFQDPALEWDDEFGGYTTYMDEKTELIALPPQPNVLCLVYRDVGCMKFVKFLTSQSPCKHYDFINTFKTLDEGDDEEDEEDDQDEDSEEDEEPEQLDEDQEQQEDPEGQQD